uniref:carbonyl reductase (NADPH) n=1 Tax=Adineta vaga TaxID=104782 RepID=B3G4R8_ADIVA|nr:carbonyl reductase-like protein [Adineta vaga]
MTTMTSNSTSFQGSIALITGSNKGIGFSTARQLGEQGLTVLIGSRNKTRGEEAAQMLQNENIQAKWIELDVSKQETIDNAAQQILNDYGRLDILINNAGIRLEGESPSQTLINKMRETFEINFFGAFAVMKAFIPLLQKSNRARIVNVSSRAASFGKPLLPDRNALAYATSKTALNMMTFQFDREFRNKNWNIKINSISPGLAKTDMNDNNENYPPPSEAARIIVHFATLPDDGPSGAFFDRDKTQMPW